MIEFYKKIVMLRNDYKETKCEYAKIVFFLIQQYILTL